MNMYDKNGLGSQALAFALAQPEGLFTFDKNNLSAAGAKDIKSAISCNTNDLKFAGTYRGYMTFAINYVDKPDYDILVDDDYAGTAGALVNGIPNFNTISAAVAAASATTIQKIMVKAGNYTESVALSKSVTLMGEGNDTVLKNDVIISNPKITISNIKFIGKPNSDFYSIHTIGKQFDDADISGLTVDRVTFTDSFGAILIPAQVGSPDNKDHSDGITIKNCKFSNIASKGIYIEKAENLSILSNEFTDCGNQPDYYVRKYGTPLDINLKYGAYHNLIIRGNVFVNNGNYKGSTVAPADPPDFYLNQSNGGAILLKTRGVGGDTGGSPITYKTYPATLDSFTIEDNQFYRNRVALSIGEPGAHNGAPGPYTEAEFEAANKFGKDEDANVLADFMDNRP
jgi:hypothetical protein